MLYNHNETPDTVLFSLPSANSFEFLPYSVDCEPLYSVDFEPLYSVDFDVYVVFVDFDVVCGFVVVVFVGFDVVCGFVVVVFVDFDVVVVVY